MTVEDSFVAAQMAQEASINLLKAYRIEKQNKNPTTIFEAINNLKLAESL